MKICNKCKKEKELSEFHIRSKNKDGHCTECKKCISERLKIYNEKNKIIISEKKKIYHKLIEETINIEINGISYEGNLNRKIIKEDYV